MTGRRLEATSTLFVNEHSTILPNWPNYWAEFRVLIFTLHLALSSYDVTYVFKRDSTVYIYLNIKELLFWNRRDIWGLSECKETRTHNHLVRKRTLNFWPNWPTDGAEMGVLICTLYLTVPSYHFTYTFQSEYRIYIWMNVKDILRQNRRNIWSLSDCY